MTKTIDLFTSKDIARIREILYIEQEGKDALTGLILPKEKSVCDHSHSGDLYVRGILHRNTNSALGRIENTWLRELSWWYPETLPVFLRKVADYIEIHTNNPDKRYRHNSFLKKLKVLFNKLNSKQMKQVLESFGKTDGKNLVERKQKFSEIVLDRNNGYDKIKAVIQQAST